MATNRVRVSLCMIVRDEEHNLAECLDPVASLFDEIIIVDTGSLDSTKEIARRYTPHVYDFAWCDDFSAARNETLRHATGDWIFWLDADDRVRPEQAARIKRLFSTDLDERPNVFLMETALQPADPTQEVLLATHMRLFRRHPDLRWQGRVHEQLRPEPAKLGFKWVFTDVRIDHLGYADRAAAARKARRKLRLLRMDYAVNPDDPSTLLHLSMALSGSGNLREARAALLRVLEISDSSSPYLRQVYAALVELSLHEGQPAEAVQISARGIAQFPDDLHLMYSQASAYYAMENYTAAAYVLETILRMPPARYLLIGAVADVQSKLALRLLGGVRRMQRSYPQAEAVFHQVLQNFPDDLSSWFNLGLVYLDQGHGPKLAAVVRRLESLPGGSSDATTLAALWHLRNGNLAAAGSSIDQLIAESPHAPCPRMLRVEWLSRNHAPWEQQLRALRDLVRIQPGNVEAIRWIHAIELSQATSLQPSVAAAPAALATASVQYVG